MHTEWRYGTLQGIVYSYTININRGAYTFYEYIVAVFFLFFIGGKRFFIREEKKKTLITFLLFWCLLFMVFVQSDKYQILWIWHEYGESAQGSNTTSLMMTLEKYNGIWCGDVTRKVASFISNQLYWYTLVTTITCYFCCFWSLLCSLWGWSPSTEQIFFALVFLQNYIVLKSKQKVDERCLAGNEAFWHDTVFSSETDRWQ